MTQKQRELKNVYTTLIKSEEYIKEWQNMKKNNNNRTDI